MESSLVPYFHRVLQDGRLKSRVDIFWAFFKEILEKLGADVCDLVHIIHSYAGPFRRLLLEEFTYEQWVKVACKFLPAGPN
jgi:hypothetical protein